MNRARGVLLRCWWWLLAAALLGVGTLAAAPSALAEPVEPGTPSSQMSWLDWIELRDSRGISVWSYELSIDRGGVMSPMKMFWAVVIDWFWSLYRAWVALAIWFLDWVLSMEWLALLSTPVLAIGDAMANVFRQLGVVPTMLTVAAAAAALWILRGKVATGVFEMSMALLVAAVATGALATPVRIVAGPDGLITQAAHAGRDLGLELSPDRTASGTAEDRRAAQVAQMVDVFLRKPTQLVNFGQVLDDGPCEAVYNQALAAGNAPDSSAVRDAVGDCDTAAGDVAANPSAVMALTSWLFYPSGALIFFLAIVLAGGVLMAGANVLFQALKLIVNLILGLLPGGGRGALMLSLAEITMSLLVLVFTSVFLSVFLEILSALFGNAAPGTFGRTFVLVDILLLVGALIYRRQRKQIQASAKRLAGWLAQRPGTSAARVPTPAGINMGAVGSAVRTVSSVAQLKTQRGIAHDTSSITDARNISIYQFNGTPVRPPARDGGYYQAQRTPGRQLPPGAGPGAAPPSTPGPEPGPGPGSGPGTGPASPSPEPGSGRARGLPRAPHDGSDPGTRRRLPAGTAKTLARTAGSAALSYATGGASTVLTMGRRVDQIARGANSLTGARRAQLAQRITPVRPAPAAGSQQGSASAAAIVRGEVITSTRPASPASASAAAAPPPIAPAPATQAPRPGPRPAPGSPLLPQVHAPTAAGAERARLNEKLRNRKARPAQIQPLRRGSARRSSTP